KFAFHTTLRSSRSMRSSNALSFVGRSSVMTRMPSSTRSVRMVCSPSTCSRKPCGLPCSSSTTVGAVLSVMRLLFSVKRVASVLEALEAAFRVKLIERAQDFAAVAGADCGHEVEIGRRAFAQHGFDRAARALRQLRRLRHRELEAVGLSERLGAVEAAL